MKKWHNIDATSPGADSAYGKASFPAQIVETQEVFNDINNAILDSLAIPKKEEISMEAIRDLLFSIRDNSIYCPICRCPEFANNEMRSSHFEPCSIGSWCEKLLRLYPREGYVIKWRR